MIPKKSTQLSKNSPPNIAQHWVDDSSLSPFGGKSGWWFQIFSDVHPDSWGNHPIWQKKFQLGWFNHQRTIIWENVGLELFSFASWPCKSEQPRNIDRKVKWSKCPTPSVGFHHHYRLGITTPPATIGKCLHVLWKGILYEPWRCPRGLTQCRR